MTEEIKKLKELIDGTDNIVFFGGAGVSTEKAVSRIFAAWTGCTTSSGTTRLKRF